MNTFWGNGSSELVVYDDWYQKNDGSYAWNYNKDIFLDSQLGWQNYSGIININAAYSTGRNQLWGDWQNNKITDGSGGSGLFGGFGGDDTLTGGGGADTFFVGHNGGGHDIITDAESSDTIWFFEDNPGDVTYSYDTATNVMHLYMQGSEVEVCCSNGTPWPTYPIYQFADGSRWTYTGQWNTISWDAAEDTLENIANSPLWGEVNTYCGTDDADNFFLGKTDGNDLILNAEQADTVHLYDAALSDIVATSADDNSIAVKLNTGKMIVVETSENISSTFKLASGESYVYNRETSSWREV